MSETIDMTPTWQGILPALLDVVINGNARLDADGCNIMDGWCSVHASLTNEHDDNPDECETAENPARLQQWRVDLKRSVTDIRTELFRMSVAADRYNELSKFIRAEGKELGHKETKFRSPEAGALDAIFQKLADLAGED